MWKAFSLMLGLALLLPGAALPAAATSSSKAAAELSAVRQRIQQKFVLVYIDANMRNDRKRNAAVIERYGNPLQHGIPVFVVLDREGTQLTTRESQSLAAATDEATAGLIRAFLDKWAK